MTDSGSIRRTTN